MKHWKKFAALCFGLCLWSAAVTPCDALQPDQQGETPGEYVIYIPPDTQCPALTEGTGGELTEIPHAEGYYTADSLEKVQSLVDRGLAEAVPNETLELLEVSSLVNDPYVSRQWYLDFLGASRAWETGYTGRGVTVALVDSGVNKSHEDLNSRNVTGYNFLGTQELRNPLAYEDDHGHGSLTAGILAAQVNNGLGGAGLTPEVSILALRSFSSSTGNASSGNGTVATALEAVGYAMKQHADIINLSIGGTADALKEMEPLLREATQQGIILLSSCGNAGGTELYYPAAFDCVTGVGWVNKQGEWDSKSQHNRSVYVTAPGVEIYGPGKGSASSYRTDSGSSFATPMVTALAVMAKQADRTIDHDRFQALLRASAQDKGTPGWDEYYGYGVISVSAFVDTLLKEYGFPTKSEYTLRLQTNGGTAMNVLKGTAGSVIDLNRYVPRREGFQFTGWYSDAALTKPVTSITLRADTTVYAAWKEVPPAVPAVDGMPFLDVTTKNWFYGDVAYVWQRGLMNGTDKDQFQPKETVDRAMMVTVLYRLAGSPEVAGSGPFSDVRQGSYYEKAVLWASRNGIVTGYTANTFGPKDPVTREQLAAILYRYAGANHAAAVFPSNYQDVKSISSYAKTAMSWCVMNNIMNGQHENLLVPKGNATRSQVAAILHRFCESLA